MGRRGKRGRGEGEAVNGSEREKGEGGKRERRGRSVPPPKCN